MSDIAITSPSDAISLVTINRPSRRNALDQAAWDDLGNAFVDLQRRHTLRAIVLTGAGGAFCAGDDIAAFAKVRDDETARASYTKSVFDCYAKVAQARVPVVAAISGACIGGGFTIASYCDFRIADSTARFGVPAAKLGLVFPSKYTDLLVSIAGLTMAKKLLYTGGLIGAEEAHAAGLVSNVDAGDPVEAAMTLLEPIVRNAPLSLEAAKLACNAAAEGNVARVEAKISELSKRANASEDIREGARAFAEKRAPRFTGR